MELKQVDDILDDLEKTFEYSEKEENINVDLKYDQKSNSIVINRNQKRQTFAFKFYKNVKGTIQNRTNDSTQSYQQVDFSRFNKQTQSQRMSVIKSK